MFWLMLLNVFLPLPPWTGIQITDLFMRLFSTFPHFLKLHIFFVYCVRSVEMPLFCLGEFHQDDVTAWECFKSPDIMAGEQAFVLLVLLFIIAADSRLPFSLSCLFPGLSSPFSYPLSPLFCLKQTHICAVRVMAATNEGSVLGLYLELWPSRSAAVPVQIMPMENLANPAHHKALVWIFKSLHPFVHTLCTHTHTLLKSSAN